MAHRYTTVFLCFHVLLIFGLLLSACSPAVQTPAIPANTQLAASQTPAALPSATAAQPSATPTQALSPSPAPSGPRLIDFTPLSAADLAKPETYHNAFLFISHQVALSQKEGFKDPNLPFQDGDELWVIKPEQKQAGRITPQGFSTALYHPASGRVKMVSYQTPAEKALIQAMGWEEVLAPELCRLPAGGGAPAPDFAACTNLKFSADGQFLAYQIPVTNCGTQVRILNLDKRMHAVTEKDRGHWTVAMPTGQILYALGHCEGGEVTRFDPLTGKRSMLGEENQLLWNAQQTAFITDTSSGLGYNAQFYGYNGETDRLFVDIKPLVSQSIADEPTWTPDGKAVLYRYMPYTHDTKVGIYTYDRPMEIVRVDVKTRSSSKVAADPKYNFRPVRWSGDYLLVNRYPFQVVHMDQEMMRAPDDERSTEAQCIAYGHDEHCGQPELFAYNYKTGKLIPWAETGLPVPEPPHAQDGGPDPAASAFYTDPAGSYHLAFGAPTNFAPDSWSNWVNQAARSLWLVPTAGEPIPWIEYGWDYLLAPKE